MAVVKPLVVYGNKQKELKSTDILQGVITWDFLGTIQTGVSRVVYRDLTIAGGAGLASIFLTSDGLTKSGANTFLYSSVLFATGMMRTINAITTAIFAIGYDYNVSTGLLRVLFGESKNTGVLIGGNIEGLELAQNGGTVRIKIDVIL